MSELISAFTQHGDPNGVKICEIYKLVIQATVSAAIQLMSTVTSGIAMPYLSPGQVLAPFQPVVGPKVGKWEQQMTFMLWSWGTGQVTGFSVQYWQTWQHLMEDRIAREQPVILSGMGRGWSGLCASVEGDFQDMSAANEKRLTTALSGQFEHIRDVNRNISSDIYMGNIIPQPGNPSFMATVMANRKWAGDDPDSIVSEMEDARLVKR
jgi:hypothetical protein